MPLPDFAPQLASGLYVVSSTLTEPEWDETTVLADDLVAAVRQLKAKPGGELQVHGSSNLLQTLIKHGLIDRYNLMIFPVVLGRGKRLFGDGALASGLRQTSSRTSSTGVVMASYEPAGPIQLGTFRRPDE